MARARSWIGGLNWVAACLGFGALFAPAARADVAPAAGCGAVEHGRTADATRLLISIDGDQVYVSEHGRPFERLDLVDGPEADQLRRMLREGGDAAAPVPAEIGRTVVADGAAGWHRRGP